MKKLAILPLVAAMACIPSIASAHKEGNFIVRGGAIVSIPFESSDNILNLGEIAVNNNVQFGLTGTYMLSDNIGIELLLATPFNHKISLKDNDVIKTKALPPSLMAQYYFKIPETNLRPYLGIGINYTLFNSTKLTGFAESLGLVDPKIKNSWGVALQAGMDYSITDNLLLNASLWWLNIDTETNLTVRNTNVSSKFDTTLNPLVVMVGIGYRF